VADAKLVVIYPRSKDVDVFEKVYQTEHVPLAVAKLAGKTKIVATKILGSPDGLAPSHGIAEVYFPSMQAASDGGKETLANTVKISTGGTPIFMCSRKRQTPRTSHPYPVGRRKIPRADRINKQLRAPLHQRARLLLGRSEAISGGVRVVLSELALASRQNDRRSSFRGHHQD
jgi:uncharacterized protein (TIGR02118 family)